MRPIPSPLLVLTIPNKLSLILFFSRKFELTVWILILGASIDRPDRSPVAEESETNLDVDMCPNPDENKGPKLKKMLSLESGKEGIKQMKKVLTTYLVKVIHNGENDPQKRQSQL